MLTDAISKVIQDNLPEAVGKELKERLIQAEWDAAEIKVLKKQTQEHLADLKQYEEQNIELRKLNLRKAELDEVARNQRVVLAEAKFIAAEDKCKAIFDLVGVVFKNPVVRQNLNGYMPIAMFKDQYGNPVHNTNTAPFSSTTETVTE